MLRVSKWETVFVYIYYSYIPFYSSFFCLGIQFLVSAERLIIQYTLCLNLTWSSGSILAVIDWFDPTLLIGPVLHCLMDLSSPSRNQYLRIQHPFIRRWLVTFHLRLPHISLQRFQQIVCLLLLVLPYRTHLLDWPCFQVLKPFRNFGKENLCS